MSTMITCCKYYTIISFVLSYIVTIYSNIPCFACKKETFYGKKENISFL